MALPQTVSRPRLTPEQRARAKIDAALEAAGWVIQDRDEIDLTAARGVAIREFEMRRGHGFADYLLFVDGQAVGALEAKKEGVPLSGVEGQARTYSDGLPPTLDAPVRPLPFVYTSTGTETFFANRLDPHPRSRRIFAVHQPDTLAEWLHADALGVWAHAWKPVVPADPTASAAGEGPLPSTLRARLRTLPSPEIPGLWSNQLKAITNLERSLAADRPRALIRMATGSGKSLTAVASIYRLIKFGGARRVLFLVDRTNLGRQAETEFENYRTYDDNRKFTELYKVQHLKGNKIASSAKVVITTIQRLYSMLRGVELDEQAEEGSQFDADGLNVSQPAEITYNASIPPEYFDIVFIDECHRSIYTLWRQVIEYFDAHLIGLTATPAKHTYGFFQQNVVMEYDQQMAVVDGVNVDFDVYKIRTQITEQGSTIEAAPGVVVGKRDRQTRRQRWEQPDEDLTYAANQLDRDVVAIDQIRLIVKTFRDRLFTEMFPDRTHVPKTLIFAKDDSHAEDIVRIVREEFGRGDDFAQKITYKVTGQKPEDLIQSFRTSYNPRIAVTVDMIATGTDVRPIEIVMFMRSIKSRVLYEQMKGRGGRVIKPDELRGVTPDAKAKTHFILVDCVRVTESCLQDTRPLDQKKGISFKKLLEQVALGTKDPEIISSLASRLTRLDKQCGADERRRIQEMGGVRLGDVTHAMVEALDLDAQADRAREQLGLPSDGQATDAQLAKVAAAMITEAVAPLASQPKLRKLLIELKELFEQIIDEVSADTLLEAGPSADAKDRALALTQSFETYLREHKDEIEALQFFYSQPYNRRLRFDDIKALADAIQAPPRQWTPERLWQAYERLDRSKVRGAAGQRLLTDVVSLVRFALHRDDELVPYADRVRERFDNWLAQQANTGRTFTPEQRRWLEMIRDHVAQSLEIDVADFDYTPFVEEGGLGKAGQVFGGEIVALVRELNGVLSA